MRWTHCAGRGGCLTQAACAAAGHRAGAVEPAPGPRAPMAAKSFSPLFVDVHLLANYSRLRVADDNPYSHSKFKRSDRPAPTPGAFADPEQTRAYFRRFLSGTTPGIAIADWACPPRSRSIKGAPASSRTNGSASARMLERRPSRALRRGRGRRLESGPRCGSARLRTPSSGRPRRTLHSQAKCRIRLDRFRFSLALRSVPWRA